MSEYQCFEFVALDRPLSAAQMAQLRAISTRAEISPTRFWNEYQWGNLKADPTALVARYFDAHLYYANWGTRRLVLRLPKARVDVKALAAYLRGSHAVRLVRARGHVLLDCTSDTEATEDDPYDEAPASLAELAPVRAELLRGDLRPTYLAWLLAVGTGEVDDAAAEPPVPAGLAALTAGQAAMVELLRIDADLLAVAAAGSASLDDEREPLRRWVAALGRAEKDAWLRRAVDEPELALGAELVRAFRSTRAVRSPARPRAVGELRARAEARRAARERRAVRTRRG